MTENNRLIHIGIISSARPKPTHLLLRQLGDLKYVWNLLKAPKEEVSTHVCGVTIEEAIRLAYKHWSLDNFRTLNCGFLYTLPERDEHGSNALFYQMAASYLSPNGIFFNEETGCNCIVNNASQEARALIKLFT